jgi:hypothetical protein
MTLLEVTRTHLEDCFGDDDVFMRISLYLSQRSKEIDMFQSGTKIAYGGNAYYGLPQNEETIRDSVASKTLLCFLGQNETAYIESLRMEMGWEFVERAQVLTVAGEMVQYEDGEVVMPTSADDLQREDDTQYMDDDMSLMIILLAIGVPISILLVLAASWCCCKMRNNLSLIPSSTADPENPMWSVDHPQSKEVRVASTFKQSRNAALPETGDDRSDRVTVGGVVSSPKKKFRHSNNRNSAAVTPAISGQR